MFFCEPVRGEWRVAENKYFNKQIKIISNSEKSYKENIT